MVEFGQTNLLHCIVSLLLGFESMQYMVYVYHGLWSRGGILIRLDSIISVGKTLSIHRAFCQFAFVFHP